MIKCNFLKCRVQVLSVSSELTWLVPSSLAVLLPVGRETLQTSLSSLLASSNTCCMVLTLLHRACRHTSFVIPYITCVDRLSHSNVYI